MKIIESKSEKKPFPAGKQDILCYGFFNPGASKTNEKFSANHSYTFMFEGIDAEKIVFDSSKGEQRQSISRTVYGNKLYDFLADMMDRKIDAKERQDGIDPSSVIGKSFKVRIEHVEKDDKTFANIEKFYFVNDEEEKIENEVICWSIMWKPELGKDGKPVLDKKDEAKGRPYKSQNEVLGCDQFHKLHDWMKEKVKKTETFKMLPE